MCVCGVGGGEWKRSRGKVTGWRGSGWRGSDVGGSGNEQAFSRVMNHRAAEYSACGYTSRAVG